LEMLCFIPVNIFWCYKNQKHFFYEDQKLQNRGGKKPIATLLAMLLESQSKPS
jgi:DUF1365 family protein